MISELSVSDTLDFHQFDHMKQNLKDLGYFVEIAEQSITIYRDKWKSNSASLPSLGLLKLRTDKDTPYYLFGGELLQSQHFSNLSQAIEKFINTAEKLSIPRN